MLLIDRKNCFINYDKVAFNQTVRICRQGGVKQYSIGEEPNSTEREVKQDKTGGSYSTDEEILNRCNKLKFGVLNMSVR